MKLTTLYKQNSKGGLQEWSIFVDGGKFWAEYGLVGGKIQSDTPTICEGKNLGKRNETTPSQQAALEAESKIKKQKDKGYRETIEETSASRFTPMLAHKFVDHGHKLPNQILASPKLDGIRLTISKDGAFSRNGKPIVAARFIQEDLAPLFKAQPQLIIDGEIYNHKYRDDFNKIVSLAKKAVRVTDQEWTEISFFLQFHIFDFFFGGDPKAGFRERQVRGQEIIGYFGRSPRIYFVEQALIDKKEVDNLHESYLQEGYEGIMLRDPDSPYECKRSYYLQKYKNFIDEEFEIADVKEGKGNWAGKAMKMLFLQEEGKEFEAVPKGSEEYRAQLLLDKAKLRGMFATVRYQNRTPDNKPRFGIVTSVRDYE